ncbi:MAG: hypothetical protein Solivirus2_46 [Solivirus sp.]|uniref:Uncharacterized protein n=1 Tax=Solivirus sp. TaxID=2487772 RepID=A0A3G5AFH8_9VIRU|nr:MAG: hypothetical protein Solivirus2_46 [Solivirus sp.]
MSNSSQGSLNSKEMKSARTSAEGLSTDGNYNTNNSSTDLSESDRIISDLSDQLHTLQLNEKRMRVQLADLLDNHNQLVKYYEELHEELHACHGHDKEYLNRKLSEIRKLIGSSK